MITLRNLTKSFGDVHAVSDISFDVPDGQITAFLGNNGAGKTTTMRMILGLDHPDHGEALINGVSYHDLSNPISQVGSLLDAHAVNPKMTAYDHLKMISAGAGLDGNNIDALLEMVGLTEAKGRPIGGFSLGMHQRLGLAAALLGNPDHIILDEPTNGLDPEAIRWVLGMLTGMAKQGKSVLISSHHLAEVSQVADNIVMIDKGTIIQNSSTQKLYDQHKEEATCIASSEVNSQLRAVLHDAGIAVEENETPSGKLIIHHDDPGFINSLAAAGGVIINHLERHDANLEDIFFSLTQSQEGK